jgi:hypothetical protein
MFLSFVIFCTNFIVIVGSLRGIMYNTTLSEIKKQNETIPFYVYSSAHPTMQPCYSIIDKNISSKTFNQTILLPIGCEFRIQEMAMDIFLIILFTVSISVLCLVACACGCCSKRPM